MVESASYLGAKLGPHLSLCEAQCPGRWCRKVKDIAPLQFQACEFESDDALGQAGHGLEAAFCHSPVEAVESVHYLPGSGVRDISVH